MGKFRGTRYADIQKELPEEERQRNREIWLEKVVNGIRTKRALKNEIQTVLRWTVKPNEEQQELLKTYCYGPESTGQVSALAMILFRITEDAMKGDLRAAGFLFKYGGIHTVDQEINREKCELTKKLLKSRMEEGKKDDGVQVIIDLTSPGETP